MKFFSFTQISNSPFLYWGCLNDVQDIPESFHQLFGLYSMPHNQLHRNDAPNISTSIMETQFEESVMSDLLASSPDYSHLKIMGILHENILDLYSQHLSKFEHSYYCISVQLSPSFGNVCLLAECKK